MRKPLVRRENGQSLVIIAAAMTVLLIFSAFAVDLAYWYLERRQMQNAADSGALVGARAIALHQSDPASTLTNGQLFSMVLDWAQRNGAQSAQVLYIRENGTKWAVSAGDGSLAPTDYDAATGVHVQANAAFPTFFARVVGLGSMNASAFAESTYGSAWSADGIAPLAFKYSKDGYNVGDIFSLFAGNEKDANATWGWLGLNCWYPSKCSPDNVSLKDWMLNGYPGEVYRNRSYMGDPGAKAAVLGQAYVSQIILLPLFDMVFQFTDKDDNRCPVDGDGNPVKGVYEGIDASGTQDPTSYCATACADAYAGVWCAHTSNITLKGQYYYHIVEFAAFEVTAVSQGGKVLDGIFRPDVVLGSKTRPSIWDKGVVIVNLTE
jgi:hypothetical protein